MADLGQKSQKLAEKLRQRLHNSENFSRIFAKPFLKDRQHFFGNSQKKRGPSGPSKNFERKKTLGGGGFHPPSGCVAMQRK